MPCLKYFVNKSVILAQYREALQICYKCEDKDTRAYMIEMMRDEFNPLLQYKSKTQKDEEVQASIDYILAKTRQRMNQVKELTDRALWWIK